MVGIEQEFLRHKFEQLLLDYLDRLARRDAGAVGDAENMGVDRHRDFAKSRVQHHIGRLAAHAGKGFQCLAGARYFAAVLVDQDLASGDDVLGLGRVQADGLDIRLQFVQAEVEDRLRRIGDRVELARGLVDADVGGLGR